MPLGDRGAGPETLVRLRPRAGGDAHGAAPAGGVGLGSGDEWPAPTSGNPRLGAEVDRCSFIASDFHRPLPAGFPAHWERSLTLSAEVGAHGLRSVS